MLLHLGSCLFLFICMSAAQEESESPLDVRLFNGREVTIGIGPIDVSFGRRGSGLWGFIPTIEWHRDPNPPFQFPQRSQRSVPNIENTYNSAVGNINTTVNNITGHADDSTTCSTKTMDNANDTEVSERFLFEILDTIYDWIFPKNDLHDVMQQREIARKSNSQQQPYSPTNIIGNGHQTGRKVIIIDKPPFQQRPPEVIVPDGICELCTKPVQVLPNAASVMIVIKFLEEEGAALTLLKNFFESDKYFLPYESTPFPGYVTYLEFLDAYITRALSVPSVMDDPALATALIELKNKIPKPSLIGPLAK